MEKLRYTKISVCFFFTVFKINTYQTLYIKPPLESFNCGYDINSNMTENMYIAK